MSSLTIVPYTPTFLEGITLAQEANARKLDANHKHLEGVLSAINTKLDIIITKMDALPVQMKENLLTTLSVELQTLMISFREAFQDYLAIERVRHKDWTETVRMIGDSSHCQTGIAPLVSTVKAAANASAEVALQLQKSYREMHEHFLKIASIMGRHG